MSQPLLPRLNEAIGGDASGQWIENDIDFLGVLSGRLSPDQGTYKEVHSIPNPWSRPVQLISAFRNDNYPNRDWLISQYRGLLATLALAKNLKLKITATHLKLNEQTFQNNDFGKSLLSLKPKDEDSILYTNPEHGAWTEIYLLELDGVVIGTTSPATLVCPTGYLPDTPKLRGLSWIVWEEFLINNEKKKLGFFKNPLTVGVRISAEEKAILSSWLTNLRNQLPEGDIEGLRTDYNRILAGTVRGILTTYIGHIGANNGGAYQANGEGEPFGIPLEHKPLKALYPAPIKERDSHVQIKPAPGKGLLPLYLVDITPDGRSLLPGILGIPAEEINVIGTTSLANYKAHEQDILNQYGNSAKFVTPAHLFLDKISFSRTSNLLPGSWLDSKMTGIKDLTILLPFQKIVQKYFSSQYLEENVTIESYQTHEGDGIKVSLKLYLCPPEQNQNPTPYTVSKSFLLKDGNELSDDYPTLALWPNLPAVPDINWREFFLLESVSDKGGVEYSFKLEAPQRTKTQEEIQPDTDNTQRAKVAECTTREFGQEKYNYWQCDWRPDILEAIKDNEYVGMIPLRTPQPQQGAATTWTVGVDFGTSFTNIALRKGDGKPEPFQFNLSLLKITLGWQGKDSGFHDSIYREFFVPDALIPKSDLPPMSTALIIKGWQDNGMTPEVITQARIYNPPNNKFSDCTKTNIKWEDKRYQEPFLFQLGRMILAQAALENVTNINWSISYPCAFSDDSLEAYKHLWKSSVITSLNSASEQKNKLETPLKTEGVTFAQYFANVREKDLIHTTCMDIGGGTSDISIWQENRLVHQASVPYAGRNLFHNLLRKNVDYFNEIFGPTEGLIARLSEASNTGNDNFNSILDVFLRLDGQTLIKGYRDNSNNPRNREFRTLLAFAHCGLYYYVGLVQKWLKQEEKIIRDDFTSLLLGGNGSRFIKWLSPTGDLENGSQINRLIKGVMLAATGLNENPQLLTLSEEPKHEACRGLVISPNDQERLHNITERHYAFLGEACKINEDEFSSCDHLNLTQFGDRITEFTITSTTEFEQYLQNFNQVIKDHNIEAIDPLRNFQTEESLTLNDDLRTLLMNNLKKECLRKQGQKSKEIEPDPPFLMVLKSFLDVLSNQWSQAKSK